MLGLQGFPQSKKARAAREVFEVNEPMFKDVLQGQPKIAEDISRIVAERQAELDARTTGMPSTEQRRRSATTEILQGIKSLFGLD